MPQILGEKSHSFKFRVANYPPFFGAPEILNIAANLMIRRKII